ncbi:hypothetical protein KCU93_g160, partial [Aureobasidium melanogenum]
MQLVGHGPLKFSLVAATSSGDTEHKVDNDSGQQGNGQNSRTEAVVETALTSQTNALCPPVESDQGIDHSGHGNQSEETSGDLTDLVAKVEETDGETAQDDGEVQPTEKGTLVGEEDLGLNAGGQGDALACTQIECGLEKWLRRHDGDVSEMLEHDAGLGSDTSLAQLSWQPLYTFICREVSCVVARTLVQPQTFSQLARVEHMIAGQASHKLSLQR